MSRVQPNVNSPMPPAWMNYITNLPRGLEIVPGHLWDTANYVSGTTRELRFFTNIQGKSLNRTNLKQQGQLPNPEAFLIQNIRVFFKTPVFSDDSGGGDATALDSRANDIVQLCNEGVTQLTIGEKPYGPWLPWTLPANSFVKGAFSTGSDLLADYMQVDGALYPLDPNLMIATGQNFEVVLSWPDGAITLSTGSQSELPIVVLFDGQRSRAIQ